MNKDLNYYMNLNYRIEILEDKEEGGFALQHPELLGCITCADTIENGIEMLKDAKKAWIEAALEDNIPIPEPYVLTQDYSGEILIKLPKTLHKKLIQMAEMEGVSMNQYCLYKLSR